MHHYILNHREMYGLPRKFNIAFDGGGQVPVLEDTNDIGFVACRVDRRRGFGARASISACSWAASPAISTSPSRPGVLLKPEECVKVAGAVVRAFIANGDRTNRLKARLKYVLDRMGREAFIAEVEKELRRAAAPSRRRRVRAAAAGRQGRPYRRSRRRSSRASAISAWCCRSAG